MPKVRALEKIEKELAMLTPVDQIKLLEKIVVNLRKTNITFKKELDWTKLYGSGKKLWKGEDAQSYVEKIRENRL